MSRSLNLPDETVPELGLPKWGPYGKEYVGLSHLADEESGHRWDFFLLPGFHRRAVIGPYARREERWHMWKATPELKSYTLRYELEWKDRVFVDLTVLETGLNSRKLVATCVNQTDLPQSLDLHFAASLMPNPVSGTRPVLPEKAVWVPALAYNTIQMPGHSYRIQQVADGCRAGEWPHALAVDGSSLGVNIFRTPGDAVAYTLALPVALENPRLIIRYHRWSSEPLPMRLSGCVEVDVDLAYVGDGMEELELELPQLSAGEHQFRLETLAGAGVVLDGFVVVEQSQREEVRFVARAPETSPELTWQEDERVLSLAYDGIAHRYQMQFPRDLAYRCRTITGDDVPGIMSRKANDSVHPHWIGLGETHTELMSLGPLSLAPHSEKTVEVNVGLDERPSEPALLTTPGIGDSGGVDYPTPFRQGIEILAANTLGNVVYPTRHQQRWIQHYSPGRAWDCLYTWDLGMLGVGMAALSPQRSTEILNQYLLPVGNPDAAFLEHGTPLPIQAYQTLEIWNRTQDRTFLEWAYPRLRQFYEFIAGRSYGSTTAQLASGLLHTWDYNYNSGGWDDYPPQHALIQEPERRRRIAPMVTTSHAIRFGKILSQIATELGRDGDVLDLRKDTTHWGQALEQAWDEEAGYFAYLEHDAKGQPKGCYRHDSGENYNRGLDGVSPLITGELGEARTSRLLEQLYDPQELWTDIGFSTVSQSAAYYSDAGYWNGAMWIPHQWFLWKALLDQGESKLAWRLAEAVLNCWEKEASQSYHSFELFRVKTGRGSGWHQFSGLSSPLLAIHAAYFEPGCFTPGFDTWVQSAEWRADGREFRAELEVQSQQSAAVLLVPKLEGCEMLKASWQGQAIPNGGSHGQAVSLEIGPGKGELVVSFSAR